MLCKVAVFSALVCLALSAPQYEYQEPTSLYETPAESVQEPVQLYETPIVAQPQNIIEEFVAPPQSADPPMEGMPYNFDWGVQDEESGNQFSHVETSDGQTTQGEYRVLMPDGRTQVVKFFDDGNGFNAEVTYEK